MTEVYIDLIKMNNKIIKETIDFLKQLNGMYILGTEDFFKENPYGFTAFLDPNELEQVKFNTEIKTLENELKKSEAILEYEITKHKFSKELETFNNQMETIQERIEKEAPKKEWWKDNNVEF